MLGFRRHDSEFVGMVGRVGCGGCCVSAAGQYEVFVGGLPVVRRLPLTAAESAIYRWRRIDGWGTL